MRGGHGVGEAGGPRTPSPGGLQGSADGRGDSTPPRAWTEGRPGPSPTPGKPRRLAERRRGSRKRSPSPRIRAWLGRDAGRPASPGRMGTGWEEAAASVPREQAGNLGGNPVVTGGSLGSQELSLERWTGARKIPLSCWASDPNEFVPRARPAALNLEPRSAAVGKRT